MHNVTILHTTDKGQSIRPTYDNWGKPGHYVEIGTIQVHDLYDAKRYQFPGVRPTRTGDIFIVNGIVYATTDEKICPIDVFYEELEAKIQTNSELFMEQATRVMNHEFACLLFPYFDGISNGLRLDRIMRANYPLFEVACKFYR